MEQIENKRFKRHKYKPKMMPILHSKLAEEIVKNTKKEKLKVNLTLNKYGDTEIELKGEKVVIPWKNGDIEIEIKEIKKVIKKEKKLHVITKKGLIPLEIRKEHYYKLALPENTYIPTAEIDGIHMHRVKDINPLKDAKIKVSTLGILKRRKLLDICTGLGYTAITAHKRGANVITVEKDKNILELAEFNPWSNELEKIPIILGDAVGIVEKFPEEQFDLIIHDPPRFSLAGELYSQDFYNQLYRILKKQGKIFHYTGSPGAKYRGKSTVRGVGERLTRAGFKVKFVEKAQGFLGIKKV